MPDAALHPRPWSIRARLVLLVLSVWLPAVVALGLLARSTFESEESAARSRMRDAAENLNAAVEAELEKALVLAQALAASATLADGDLARFQAEAARATQGSGIWAVLVDREHQLVNSTLAAPRTVRRVPGAPFVEEGAPAVTFIRRGPIQDKAVVGLFVAQAGVRPVRYNVGVALDVEVLQGVLAQYRGVGPDGMIASAVDGQQRIIARNRDPERWLGVVATGDIRDRLSTRVAGFGQSTTLDGVSSLSYISRPNRFGWTVVTALPLATLQQSARRLTLQASIASGLLLLLGLALAAYAARRIARPLAVLESAADTLGRNRVPPLASTGLSEADAVAAAMHTAGQRLEASGQVLQERVKEAVRDSEQAQHRLLEAQKHEAIGRLTGGIAHDFNNLLQTISMGLHVVDKAVPHGVHSRAVAAAMNACSKGADVVRQMLAFRRAQPLQAQPVPLRDFLLRNEELTRRAVGERIRLSADVQPEVQAVHADPTQLELALLNLIFNARDAMRDGGHIALRARLARPDENLDLGAGPFVCLEVQDDGPGIPPELQAKVFEPYFTTKPVGAGSGLGLAQVLAFARGSGGDVRLASTPGQGTCVTMLLPACEAGTAEAAATPAMDADGPPLHVLMVEDDILVATVVEPALRAEGHEVTLCAAGDEALALLQRGAAFDVVFTDVVMPGPVSGLDLADWCAAHRPELPVVVATGYTAQQVDTAHTLLRKPYTMGQLLAALHTAERSDPAAQPS